jgi:hypothetical protein
MRRRRMVVGEKQKQYRNAYNYLRALLPTEWVENCL